MTAKVSSDPSSSGSSTQIVSWARGPLRWLALATLLTVIGAAAWYSVWQVVKDQVVTSPHYRLDPRDIVVTQSPEWIRADIKAEVIRDAGLEGQLSLLDADLAPRLHRAFSLHPWVADVTRVTKLSTKVEVQLAFRRPVCMVEVPGGLYPVDAAGVLLPSADFSAQEAARYPRLAGIHAVTEGPVGAKWPDPRVVGSAGIALQLLNVWTEWKLQRIEPAGSGSVEPVAEDSGYVLHTRQGTRIFWGSAPGREGTGEGTAADKVMRLKQYVAEHGTLDAAGEQDLDLRPADRLTLRPR